MHRSYCVSLSIVVVVGWLFVAPLVAPAQEAPAATGELAASENPLELIKDYKGEKIEFNLDIAAFKLYDAPGAKIEVYYDIPNTGLVFKEVASGELATTLMIAVKILDKDGKVVKEAANRGSTRVKNEKEAKDPALSSKFASSFNLDPGTYVFKVGVKDNLSGKIGVQEKEFEVKSPAKDELGISSVEFAKEVQKAKEGEDSGFLKESLNMLVTPHPSRTYHLGDTLSVYFNIYNLKVDNAQKPRFKITYKFKREGDRRIVRRIVEGERVEGANQSHLYSFELTESNKFNVGNYTLFISVTDELAEKAVETKEPFKIVK
ncbi:MAG: hypothetical protein JW759_01965 [Candidatus Coatesbacteria bacterium]|nr:hypothetical protein [Candidatus Coatesbacteria bacterium]